MSTGDVVVSKEEMESANAVLDAFSFSVPVKKKTNSETGEEEEEEDTREPITLNMTSFGIEGELVLSFSETLLSLDELGGGLNLTVLNIVRKRVLDLNYWSNAAS